MITKLLHRLKLIDDPEVIFLIGLPGSGKTDYALRKLAEDKKYRKYTLCSTDRRIEVQSIAMGKRYHEVYDDLFPEAFEGMLWHIEVAIENNMSMFIDTCTVSKAERKKILDKIPSHYKKRAIIFHVPNDELKKRLLIRADETGKITTDAILMKILEKYEHPTKDEFDIIEPAYQSIIGIK